MNEVGTEKNNENVGKLNNINTLPRWYCLGDHTHFTLSFA
jgi:hypothetical protein